MSSVAGADSESVDELLEEGNAFESDVVKGVEDAGNANEKEVRTHEVPQDDVPGEYLDKPEKPAAFSGASGRSTKIPASLTRQLRGGRR